ncbi:MAG: imidazole glycerol phosphate synthase subunit HisH [Pseudomonadota bacterium]
MANTDVVIVDYDAGNLRSVQRACAEVGLSARISRAPADVLTAPRVIFPGVGAAGPAMQSIEATGMRAALQEFLATGRPLLGICLGMQISLERSEEQCTQTLGLLPGMVRRFSFSDHTLKVPHMGWNRVRQVRPHPLLAGLEENDEFYFVHGYYPQPSRDDDVFAVSDYEFDFPCAVGRANYFGTQFHPEKSGRVGLRLLAAFRQWDGTC